jgi:hypothetical protein
MRDYRNPYLAVQDPKIMMAGKGAPRSTVFGVLGRTMEGSSVGAKSLGGLVADTKTKMKAHDMVIKESRAPQTERKIVGSKSKTTVPGAHMGQVPYPGFFMVAVGKRL